MDTTGIGSKFVSLFPSLIPLSDLGVGGIVATAVSAAVVIVPREPDSPNDVNNAQSSFAFIVQHSAQGGGGSATATPYLMTSFDGGATWMVAAQGTVLNPGDNLFEAIPCQALGQLVGVAWVLTGAPAPTARGKAWLATNDVVTTQTSQAVVSTTYATPATSVTPATQAWVTAQFEALTWKAPVRVATTTALPAYTFSASANTITANANGALPNIDGVALAVGDRLLLKDGAAGADNGIYTVTSLGSAGTPFVLTRAADANVSADVVTGMATIVTAGTVNANSIFRLTTAGVIALNTTALTFSSRLTVGAAQADGDAVNLDVMQAQAWKQPVRVATAAALPAYTRVNNTITANANGALAAVDGINLVAGDRLLLKDGAAGADNGIYVVTDAGGPGTPFILTRAPDMSVSADVTSELQVAVQDGTTNKERVFYLSTLNPIVLNTTALSFAFLRIRSGLLTIPNGSNTVNSADLGMGSLVNKPIVVTANQGAFDATATLFRAVGNANGTVSIFANANATANTVVAFFVDGR